MMAINRFQHVDIRVNDIDILQRGKQRSHSRREPEMMHLPAIKETVPVYHGSLRLKR